MNIIQLGKYYWPVPGGIERHTQHLCEGLASRGHNVTCIVSAGTSPSGTSKINGVTVRRIYSMGNNRPPCHPQLGFLLRRLPADIMHVHMPNPSAELGALLARPKHLVVSYHADIVGLRRWYNPLQKRLLEKAERIIVSTPTNLNSRQLRSFKDKCVVVPYGVDLHQHKKKADALNFLFVGRLVPYKGLTTLVRSMVFVHGNLTIIGKGPEYKKLMKLIKRLALERRVTILREVPDKELGDHYASADVFVLPSINRSEAFGIVQLEAMREGVPVISTAVGTGTNWVNKDGESGLVVPPKDIKALAEAMQKLQDPKLHKRLSDGARKRAEEFSTEHMVEHIEALYKEVCA